MVLVNKALWTHIQETWSSKSLQKKSLRSCSLPIQACWFHFFSEKEEADRKYETHHTVTGNSSSTWFSLVVESTSWVKVSVEGPVLSNGTWCSQQTENDHSHVLSPSCNFNVHLFSAGLDKIEFLQSHENQEIYQKAFDLIEHYFGTEDEDSSIAPQVDLSQQQYIFQQCEAPMEGFQLWGAPVLCAPLPSQSCCRATSHPWSDSLNVFHNPVCAHSLALCTCSYIRLENFWLSVAGCPLLGKGLPESPFSSRFWTSPLSSAWSWGTFLYFEIFPAPITGK